MCIYSSQLCISILIQLKENRVPLHRCYTITSVANILYCVLNYTTIKITMLLHQYLSYLTTLEIDY